MSYSTYKINNSDDFNRITKGIKVARCMQMCDKRNDTREDLEPIYQQLLASELVVSDSMCCSLCNIEFETQFEQRLHYKLDWHRYNLKRDLNSLKSVSEDTFIQLAHNNDISSLSGSEISDIEDSDFGTSVTRTSNVQTKNKSANKNGVFNKSKRISERRGKEVESDNSDSIEYNEVEVETKEKLQAVASRHTKVFFENDDGEIFSIYRCLLHHKKEVPEKDSELIAQALNVGKKTKWTIILIGGGHFAAAVFQDGEAIVHKSFHRYIVRAKQGFAQNNRTHAKSAGAMLRRQNETLLMQEIQETLHSWTIHITNSLVILYRAVGRYNRKLLFSGKNAPLDKHDFRIRPITFRTSRPTHNEVLRVYDIVNTIEVYGLANDFTDSFPISSRHSVYKKASKVEVFSEISKEAVITDNNSQENNDKIKTSEFASKKRRNIRSHIDRAKPRKSPNRPLPAIIVGLAQSSPESSELDECNPTNSPLIEQKVLEPFQDSTPNLKNKKINRQKKKVKKETAIVNKVLLDAKTKLWNACKVGDNKLLSSVINELLTKVEECEKQNKKDNDDATTCNASSPSSIVNMKDVIKLLNDSNGDGNTLLHLAALGGYHEQIRLLLETGSNPCNKNKKLQTPYAVTNEKKTRNVFRRFIYDYPDKYNYQKSQIPGPLNDEIEQTKAGKKKEQRKEKRLRHKCKKKEFELKKQEEDEKQRFLGLHDKEKRALLERNQMLSAGYTAASRCFQCAVDMTSLTSFEYYGNHFCSMPCLKEHRLHQKTVI